MVTMIYFHLGLPVTGWPFYSIFQAYSDTARITLFSKHAIFQQIRVIIDHALLTNVSLISLPQLTPCYTVKLFYLKCLCV